MRQKIDALLQEIAELKAQKLQEVEDIRVRLVGKKGSVTKLFEDFRSVPAEQKREFSFLPG